MKYNDNGTYRDLYIKSFDTVPIGTEVDFNGTNIPDGWTEIESYSTNEVKTGETWIDRKPIYRKVFTGTTASTAGQIATLGNIANLDTIIDIYGSIMSSSGYWANVPMYYVNPNTATTYYCVAQVDPSKNVYVLSSYISTNVKVIVKYTKTTD